MKHNPEIDCLWNPRTLSNHTMAILDLDGVIADNSHRLHLIPPPGISKEEANVAWDNFHKDLHLDDFLSHNYKMYCYLCGYYPTVRRVMLTGRSEKNRFTTVRWLKKHKIEINELYFRPDDDHRPAHEFKMEQINKLIAEGLNPAFSVDDTPSNCQATLDAKIYTYIADKYRFIKYIG